MGFFRGLYWGLEFPKIQGTLFWGPYNKDPTFQGTILVFPMFGNPLIVDPLVSSAATSADRHTDRTVGTTHLKTLQ